MIAHLVQVECFLISVEIVGYNSRLCFSFKTYNKHWDNELKKGLRFFKDCTLGPKGRVWAVTIYVWDFATSMCAVTATV